MFLHIYTLPRWALSLLLPIVFFLWYGAESVIAKKQIKRQYIRLATGMLFLVWLFAVLWETLFSRKAGEYRSFQPLFESYRMARLQPENYRSNFMNVLLFVPGGLLLTAMWSSCRIHWKKCLLITFLLGIISVAIECAQLYCRLGFPEADDILHNTIGGFTGGAMVELAHLLRAKKCSHIS